jgi:DNA-directed RNA polymerase subunit beta'|uniref:DNA-directed RNA polymerase n=1 Tax=Thorea hispida TaxID=202687 RepID=A0A1C9CAB3_9FLOR|nr:RNA polymerase beta'' subunit [Thorea hispida]AOM65332.1 RNA polymerase beta'' subunit [Thorea hispida]UNJ79177.1 RNA polymerase beta subunit [Thorea hispida]
MIIYNEEFESQLKFYNCVIDKTYLKTLIVWAFRNYGIARAANMVDNLKDLGFHYATKAGISLSLEDLRVPPAKQILLQSTMQSISDTDYKYRRGEITAVERFQKVIDTWNNASESLKKEVIGYFKQTDPLNSIYMMAFSGARGNISQVRQLVGMRGLMSDPQGQIIDLPISSNFREGLTVTDYFISSYGARKGLVDTALRTADSGYLTRRLVDVSQDIIIREFNCKTSRGIMLEDLINNQKLLVSISQSLLGRALADNIIDPISKQTIAKADQIVDIKLIDYLININTSKILIRSPMTCQSIGSVCQLCYGWHLAHSRIVDIGEAIGIIAAQSIGEPGTQLTMRTFHTGGVFTGELSEKIYAPFSGIFKYPEKESLSNIRTRYGDHAILVEKACQANILSNNNNLIPISLSKGTILFANNNTEVVNNQLIGEFPLNNRSTTEKAQKTIITDLSGKIQFTNLTIEEIHNKQQVIRVVKKEGLLWVLSGKTYKIPDNSTLVVTKGQNIFNDTILAKINIKNKYPGKVRLITQLSHDRNINVIVKSLTLTNIKIYTYIYFSNSSYILETNQNEKFILRITNNQIVNNNQIIADMISSIYLTQTGGILKYLDLPVARKKTNSQKDYYEILDAGYILWISEETHEINKDISALFVNNGDFIDAGTEIIKNLFTKNAGIVELVETDGIIKEVIIKPGDIYLTNNNSFDSNKRRGFLRPGENIIQGVKTNKLVYWEYVNTQLQNYILIRPVIIYAIPCKEYDFFSSPDIDNTLRLKLVRRTFFRDGDRIKSVEGINLVTTHLVLDIDKNYVNLNCCTNLSPLKSNQDVYKLEFIIAETIPLKIDSSYEFNELKARTQILVKESEEISANTIVAQTEVLSNTNGIIDEIDLSNIYHKRILIVRDLDQKIFNLPDVNNFSLQVGSWICAGDNLYSKVHAIESGQISKIENNQLTLRIGQPYLLSQGTVLHVNNRDLVQRGESIASLVFERMKTGDIIQGLPRVEEILEARKKTDINFNPHILLESYFHSYLNAGLNLHDSALISVQELQTFLVKEVQLVYQSQGVDIADKHLEVIVKQMTSKVRIEFGGDTNYLPGELIELQKIQAINKTMKLMEKKEAAYYPILLGITKASLNTESFISAASFQETTKVLTEAAIAGRLDWLKGLKENVIIGRLIPAGTGFNIYNKLSHNKLDDIIDQDLTIHFQSEIQIADDIILDDRSIADNQ